MTGRVEMLKRVRVRRILAAPSMATGKTYAELVPRRAKRETLLAAAPARRYFSSLTKVFATLGH